eukprot:gene27094-35810_t
MNCLRSNRRLNTVVPAPDYKALLKKYSNFSQHNLENFFQLYEGFCNDKGYFVHHEFLELPELSFSPILKAAVEREFENLVTEPPSSLKVQVGIGFDCFVGILQKFLKEESSESKLEYLYSLMKSPQAALLQEEDFIRFQMFLNHSSYPAPYIASVYASMWKKCLSVSGNGNGMTLEAFSKCVSQFDLKSGMTINF